jgi:hypothetical protein
MTTCVSSQLQGKIQVTNYPDGRVSIDTSDNNATAVEIIRFLLIFA